MPRSGGLSAAFANRGKADGIVGWHLAEGAGSRGGQPGT